VSERDGIEALIEAIRRYNDPFKDGLVKDVYSDSVSILHQVGLLD
jgi:hypothetical protein